MTEPSSPIREVMSRGALSVEGELTLSSVAAVLGQLDIGVALVHGPAESIGVVSERDIVRALDDGADLDEVWAADVMIDELVVAEPQESVTDVAERMIDEGVRHVTIVDRGKIVGVVSARDLLPVFVEHARATLAP
jgi:CBS domain-containing protein